MQISLSPEERQVLSRILKNYLPVLGELIHKTENYDWRLGYKRDEAIVRELVARLEGCVDGWQALGPAGDPANARTLLTDVGLSISPS